MVRSFSGRLLRSASSLSTLGHMTGHNGMVVTPPQPPPKKKRESRVQSLAEHASIELHPHCVPQFIETTEAWLPDERLHARRTVFVNMLKDTTAHFDAVGKSLAMLSEKGHCPVPTVPATIFRSEDEADAILKMLASCGAKEAFVVKGQHENGLTTSKVADLACHYFDRVAFPAFPAGHPNSVDALENKLRAMALKKTGGCSVVTQWSPNCRTTSHWLTSFLETHENHKVYVGVAGPAPRPKLESFADRTHVPLRPPRPSEADLFHAPTDAVVALANDLDKYNVHPDQVHLHLFSLKVARTLAFLHRLSSGTHQVKGNLIA